MSEASIEERIVLTMLECAGDIQANIVLRSKQLFGSGMDALKRQDRMKDE